MPFTPQQPPAGLDTDGLRKHGEEQFRDIARAWTEIEAAIAAANAAIAAIPAPVTEVPVGSVMMFYSAAAPTGWTKLTTQNDKALRVVSGSGGVAGGTNAFSTVMAQTVTGNHTLTVTEMPSHRHGIFPGSDGTGGTTLAYPGTGSGVAQNNQTTGIGGDNPHNHPITMAMQYIDIILASKN